MGKKKKDKTTGAEAATDFEHTEAALEKRAAKYVSTKDQKGAHAKGDIHAARCDDQKAEQSDYQCSPSKLFIHSNLMRNLTQMQAFRKRGPGDCRLLAHSPTNSMDLFGNR